MKKLVSLLLILAVTVCLFAGCQKTDGKDGKDGEDLSEKLNTTLYVGCSVRFFSNPKWSRSTTAVSCSASILTQSV